MAISIIFTIAKILTLQLVVAHLEQSSSLVHFGVIWPNHVLLEEYDFKTGLVID